MIGYTVQVLTLSSLILSVIYLLNSLFNVNHDCYITTIVLFLSDVTSGLSQNYELETFGCSTSKLLKLRSDIYPHIKSTFMRTLTITVCLVFYAAFNNVSVISRPLLCKLAEPR